MLDSLAIIIERPFDLSLRRVRLDAPAATDVVVEVAWSGVSTGTEKLIFTGEMPPFPGMGYPLVPGYEAAGTIVEAGHAVRGRLGETVFVPGARCFGEMRALFGADSRHLVVPAERAVRVPAALGANATLLALAATARHAIRVAGGAPELIVGHGVLGRLIARLATLDGGAPVVWETRAARFAGAQGYEVWAAADDPRRDYRTIIDASGDSAILDQLIGRLAPGGMIALAGFYAAPLGFAFPPAFMREARIAIAAQWQPEDLADVAARVAAGRLDLSGLVTHRVPAADAAEAYPAAFNDDSCLKLLIDWRDMT